MATPVAAPATDRVNLKAYCKTFEAIGNDPDTGKLYADEICEELHSNWRAAERDVFIYQDNKKSGSVIVPKFGDVLGKWRIAKWNEFSYNKSFNNVPEEVLSYFFAGAFGLKAIPYQTTGKANPVRDPEASARAVFFREDMDPSLAVGLKKLFNICLHEERGENCLESVEAKNVTKLWEATQSWKSEEFEGTQLRSELKLLTDRYEALKEQAINIKNRDLFSAHARKDEDYLMEPSESIRDLPNKIKVCRSLIKLVMSFQDGDSMHITREKIADLKAEYLHQVTQIRTLRQKKLTNELRKAEKTIDTVFPKKAGLQSQINNYQRKSDVAEAILKWVEDAPASADIPDTRVELSTVVGLAISGQEEAL